MPSKSPPKTEVSIADPTLDYVLRQFSLQRQVRLDAEKAEEATKSSMAGMLEGYVNEHGADIYRTSDTVTVTVANRGEQPTHQRREAA